MNVHFTASWGEMNVHFTALAGEMNVHFTGSAGGMLVGMVCPECGAEVKGVVCRACQAKRTRAGILRHQRRFLQTWVAGQIQLRVKRLDGVLHLELFDDRWHSYCDMDMFAVSEREFVQDLPADLCPACLTVFEDLVAEAKVEK